MATMRLVVTVEGDDVESPTTRSQIQSDLADALDNISEDYTVETDMEEE